MRVAILLLEDGNIVIGRNAMWICGRVGCDSVGPYGDVKDGQDWRNEGRGYL